MGFKVQGLARLGLKRVEDIGFRFSLGFRA